MTVFATVGLPGSGKGEFAAVAEQRGLPVVTMGDVIRAACRDRGRDPATEHGAVATQLREEGGPAAVAERALPTIEDALESNDDVLVDGIRSDAELDALDDRFGDDVTLVSIEAPRSIRRERLADRGRADDGSEGESLAERDEREKGFGMDAAMERADVRIDNTGGLEAFRERARTLLDEGLAGYRRVYEAEQ